MGCTDRESNFQKEIFKNGTWWATHGYTPSWEGPIEELVKKFPEYAEPDFRIDENVYSAERIDDSDIAIVRPIGQIALRSS